MLRQLITVLCHSNVGGPTGKLFVNNLYELEDSEYVRTLIKSGTVSLVDPPSLDPVFLERAGYPLCDGYVYSEGLVVGPEDDAAPGYHVFGIVESAEVVTASSKETSSKGTTSEAVVTATSAEAAPKGPEPTTTPVETAKTIPEGIHESIPEEDPKNATNDSEEATEKTSNGKDDSQEGESNK